VLTFVICIVMYVNDLVDAYSILFKNWRIPSTFLLAALHKVQSAGISRPKHWIVCHSLFPLLLVWYRSWYDSLPRDAMHPQYMLWPCVCLSVCVCVCLSVLTSRSSTKTAKHRIIQTKPHDSPGTLVFWCQRPPRNSTEVTPYGGTKCRWGGSKSATFDK